MQLIIVAGVAAGSRLCPIFHDPEILGCPFHYTLVSIAIIARVLKPESPDGILLLSLYPGARVIACCLLTSMGDVVVRGKSRGAFVHV